MAVTHAKRQATAASVGSLRRERHTVVTRAVSAEAPPKQKAAPANGAGDKIRVGINGAKTEPNGPLLQPKYHASCLGGTYMMYTGIVTPALLLPAGFGRIGRLVARCPSAPYIVLLCVLLDVC